MSSLTPQSEPSLQFWHVFFLNLRPSVLHQQGTLKYRESEEPTVLNSLYTASNSPAFPIKCEANIHPDPNTLEGFEQPTVVYGCSNTVNGYMRSQKGPESLHSFTWKSSYFKYYHIAGNTCSGWVQHLINVKSNTCLREAQGVIWEKSNGADLSRTPKIFLKSYVYCCKTEEHNSLKSNQNCNIRNNGSPLLSHH